MTPHLIWTTTTSVNKFQSPQQTVLNSRTALNAPSSNVHLVKMVSVYNTYQNYVWSQQQTVLSTVTYVHLMNVFLVLSDTLHKDSHLVRPAQSILPLIRKEDAKLFKATVVNSLIVTFVSLLSVLDVILDLYLILMDSVVCEQTFISIKNMIYL